MANEVRLIAGTPLICACLRFVGRGGWCPIELLHFFFSQGQLLGEVLMVLVVLLVLMTSARIDGGNTFLLFFLKYGALLNPFSTALPYVGTKCSNCK